MADYSATRARVEQYFDQTATATWDRLTSDAPVSRIRATVRAGRDQMRALMLSRLPDRLDGLRILDAGCGTGVMTAELARRGANVVAVDISPRLVGIAAERLPAALQGQVRFEAGDLSDDGLGRFDFVMAMDSLIYYGAADIAALLKKIGRRTRGGIVLTVAPRTPLLMAMWGVGQMFPRGDRSPRMVPHSVDELGRHIGPGLQRIGRVTRGFYISECLEYRP